MVVKKLEGLVIRPTASQYDQAQFIMDLLLDDVGEHPKDSASINSFIAMLAADMDMRLNVASYLRWGVLTSWFMSLKRLTRVEDAVWGEDRMIYGKPGEQRMIEFEHGGAVLKLGVADE